MPAFAAQTFPAHKLFEVLGRSVYLSRILKFVWKVYRFLKIMDSGRDSGHVQLIIMLPLPDLGEKQGGRAKN